MPARRWLLTIVLCGLVAALAIASLQTPRDADSYRLARERAARHSAWLKQQLLPGAAPATSPLEARLAAAGFKWGAPIFIRVFKQTFELEVWLKRGDRFEKFATYPICYFSGNLGPKLRTGDWQSPEGIYQVEARQLNPNSRWHKAFNLGFPNAFDRAHGRTGSFLMVHGGCSSVGCYAITNPAIDDVYRLASAAIAAGQSRFQVQALPFRLTAEALAARASNRNAAFWAELKPIAEAFDVTGVPPDVGVCSGHYVLNGTANAKGSRRADCRSL